MYTSKECVLLVIRNSDNPDKTIKNFQSQISKWRKKKNIDKVMMFTYAIETYRMFHEKRD
ncbi:hypothetical protein VP277E431_P0245 [Vibrio phage 277E43-1]|nr:hypothetical protein VP277E431_P0245 [Vibrio phage 277E43-1]